MVYVLRLGHRPERDKRVTTHVCLTARALGAKGIAIWRPDPKIRDSVMKAVKSFGGGFEVTLIDEWRPFLRDWAGVRVHLTMYGQELGDGIAELKRLEGSREHGRETLVVVGAEKMPPFVYRNTDIGISVGNQPHSEVAALALFLDRYFGGRAHLKEFPGAKLRILPSSRGKSVEDARPPRDPR